MKAILKKDLIIPKGTEFEDISGSKSEYYDAYEGIFSLTKNDAGNIIIDSEMIVLNPDYFEFVE